MHKNKKQILIKDNEKYENHDNKTENMAFKHIDYHRISNKFGRIVHR
jgi:hypothetical protein